MTRKNMLVFAIVLILFTLALLVLLPVEAGILGKRGMKLGLDLQGGLHMVYQADLSTVEPGEEIEAVEGAIAVIEKRINVLGVTEPIIQRQGVDRILVELPGISEVEEAKTLIGQTALLEFGELVIDEEEEAKWVNEIGRWKPATTVINGEEKGLTSAYFKENTYVTQDKWGGVLLVFEWDDEGSELSKQITSRLLGERLGIFLGRESLLGDDGKPIAPVVGSTIIDSGQIEGLSYNESIELSKLLNAGRIPIPLTPIYEQTVSPLLGIDFVGMSVKAGLVGIALVMLFMIVYYRLPGVLASLALIFYGALVLAIFKLIPVTLTLAGIGGFVLSIGMAVDANVLIFERMKEELRMGQTVGSAMETGFNRAWTAIRDSNITTFIVCGILYWVGSSIVAGAPVKGFALTLFIGVFVSMLTAIVVTRTLLRLFVGTRLAQQPWLFSAYLGRK